MAYKLLAIGMRGLDRNTDSVVVTTDLTHVHCIYTYKNNFYHHPQTQI